MTVDLKKVRKWYDALLTTSHPQAVGVLREGDGRCCLGIYLEECTVGKWESVEVNGTDNYYWQVKGDTTSHKYDLPASEFGDSDPVLKIPSRLLEKADATEERASELNDTHDFTFAEIAECVKETWPEAFEESQ